MCTNPDDTIVDRARLRWVMQEPHYCSRFGDLTQSQMGVAASTGTQTLSSKKFSGRSKASAKRGNNALPRRMTAWLYRWISVW